MEMQENQIKSGYVAPSSETINLATEQMICWSNEDPIQDPI